MEHFLSPEVLAITSVAAKPIVQKGMEKLINRVTETDNKLSEDFDITSKEIAILCLESVEKYSAIIDVKKIPTMKKKIDFKHGIVKRCSLRPLDSLEKLNAISVNETGFTIDFKYLQKGEKYVMDLEYDLSDDFFLDALVDRHKPRETPGSDENRYWMISELKHLDVLNSSYGKIDLYDLDFKVDVGISQDLGTKIPKIYREQLKQLIKIAGPLGRDEAMREYFKFRGLKTKKYGKESLNILGEISKFFLPDKFKGYVDVNADFRYYNCERGTNEFEIALSWPRSMIVISRTDLSLRKPTAKGELVYKKKDFLDQLSELF